MPEPLPAFLTLPTLLLEMNQHVIVPSSLLPEGSLAIAKVAGVRLHPRVDTPMNSEIPFASEFLCTDSTFEFFLLHMDLLVGPQRGRTPECLPTNFAVKRFLPRVDWNVVIQALLIFVGPLATGTLEGTLIGVLSHVNLQSSFLHSRIVAKFAFKLPIICMDPQMPLQCNLL